MNDASDIVSSMEGADNGNVKGHWPSTAPVGQVNICRARLGAGD